MRFLVLFSPTTESFPWSYVWLGFFPELFWTFSPPSHFLSLSLLLFSFHLLSFMISYTSGLSLIHCVIGTGLELLIFLTQPPNCWYYMTAPPHMAYSSASWISAILSSSWWIFSFSLWNRTYYYFYWLIFSFIKWRGSSSYSSVLSEAPHSAC